MVNKTYRNLNTVKYRHEHVTWGTKMFVWFNTEITAVEKLSSSYNVHAQWNPDHVLPDHVKKAAAYTGTKNVISS